MINPIRTLFSFFPWSGARQCTRSVRHESFGFQVQLATAMRSVVSIAYRLWGLQDQGHVGRVSVRSETHERVVKRPALKG